MPRVETKARRIVAIGQVWAKRNGGHWVVIRQVHRKDEMVYAYLYGRNPDQTFRIAFSTLDRDYRYLWSSA